MRRMLLLLGTLAALSAGVPESSAREANDKDRDREEECKDYCGDRAADRCEDVSSTWCNVFIVGCLAGCGISNC